jgi:hypothetical protein
MAEEGLRYDRMVETALRSVVREALSEVAREGLPGEHHFYVTFRTDAPEVSVPDFLRERYPREMTIVLQHQFWDLEIEAEGFSVTLSFSEQPTRLTIPFAAITAFADPSVRFGLQFEALEGESVDDGEAPHPGSRAETPKEGPSAEQDDDKVVTLEHFRKK